MSDSELDTLRLMAQDMGISMSGGHLRVAASARAAFRTRLQELREVSLPFIEAIEPAHVWHWIVRGGHSLGKTRWAKRKKP